MSYAKRKKASEVDWDQARALHESGLSFDAIGQELGITAYYVKRGLRLDVKQPVEIIPGALSYLYVIGPANGPYKVGKADDPVHRRTLLQSGNPYPLHIFMALPIELHLVHLLEKETHRRLSGGCERLVGEWFNYPLPEIMGIILESQKELPDLLKDVIPDEAPLFVGVE